MCVSTGELNTFFNNYPIAWSSQIHKDLLNIECWIYFLVVFYTPFIKKVSLTGITIVELILMIISSSTMGSVFVPQLCISVIVILHQRSKEDDEDDFQDDA